MTLLAQIRSSILPLAPPVPSPLRIGSHTITGLPFNPAGGWNPWYCVSLKATQYRIRATPDTAFAGAPTTLLGMSLRAGIGTRPVAR